MMMIHRDELITLILLREDAEGVDDDCFFWYEK